MLAQLFFANFHFAVYVFCALVFFTTGWLHLDSWSLDKKRRIHMLRSIGFFLLSISFVLSAINLETASLQFINQLIKIASQITILISLVKEPILHPPSKAALIIPFALIAGSSISLSASLFLLIAFVYYRKATEGYEKQIKPASFAFFLIFLSEFANVFNLLSNTNIVFWSNFLKEFGVLWVISHTILLAGGIVLGVWVAGYVRFRANVQLFIITVASVIGIFLITTVSFTYLLLKNLEADALDHLKTDVNVLGYTIERLQLEALANVKSISGNDSLQRALVENNTKQLQSLTGEFMISQNTSFLTVTSKSGKVVMRAEDPENIGDLLANDPLVVSSLAGTPLTGISIREGLIAPTVLIKASAPIHDSTKRQNIIGTVTTGFNIDNAFVDGIKKLTNLDVAIFANDIRAATTFVSPDGKSRFIGTKESNKVIINKVIGKKEVFIGAAKVLNQPFYTAYSPLISNDNVIGMLFVGKHQTKLLVTAEESTRLTFLGSAVLMVLSLIPSYFISRYIHENLHA